MKFTNIDIDLLRALVFVSNAQGFTKAAQQLFRTQSAISLQIKKLEQFTNAQLLERGKVIRLTPAGLKVYEYAVKILDLNDDLVRLFNFDISLYELKISLPEYHDPHLIKTLLGNHRVTSTHFDFLSLYSDQAAKLIGQHQLDMAFILHTELPGGIEIVKIPLSWVSATGSAIYQGNAIALVLPPEGSFIRLIAQQALSEPALPSTIICSASERNTLTDVMSAGKGVGVMPSHAVPEELHIIVDERLPPLPIARLFIKLPEHADMRVLQLASTLADAYHAQARSNECQAFA